MSGLKLMSFAQWRAWAVGKWIDVDGAYGAQCWDAFADYAMRCHGATMPEASTSGNAGADSGLASSLWLKFPARPGLDAYFTRLGREASIQEGDVLVWARSRLYPDSHVAIATGRTTADRVECVSQNHAGSAAAASGATEVVWLPTGGLLGVLRPKGEDDVLNNDDKKWIIDTFAHMLSKTAREKGLSADGSMGKTLFEKIDAVPALAAQAVLNARMPRQGGPEGETSLGGTVAWLDANLQATMAIARESAVQQGVDPAVIEKAIQDAMKNAVLPSAKAIADAVADEQADRLGKKAQ